ncbi:MAG: FecR domain-containing protein [Anaerolineae bacterium]|nr:FecR domain-containing protein [Anaerolineae bacterium]
MRKNPERMAWVVLLVSFFICIGLAVAVPLGARAFALFSQVEQNVSLEVERGPVRVTWAGRGEPIAIAEQRDAIPERTIITTDLTEGRLVMHAPQEDRPVVTSVQLYDNTGVVLSSARSPRFSISQLPHRVALEVLSGRVRINVSGTEDRPTTAEVQTPHGAITLAEGSYEVKVNSMTEVTVRQGQATLRVDQQEMSLVPNQRAAMGNGKVSEPLPAVRNLITNGDFHVELNGWTTYSRQADPEQPAGNIGIVSNEGRRVVNFYRDGSNHAEVGIRQEIDYDVRDFTSLELHLALRVISEDIGGFGGCGSLGSECPIIVRIDYEDVYGSESESLHGFYIGEPQSGWLTYEWAEPVREGNWQTYDSGNLMEELAGAPPALIKSLTIYASGHSFHAMVTEVELLAQE